MIRRKLLERLEKLAKARDIVGGVAVVELEKSRINIVMNGHQFVTDFMNIDDAQRIYFKFLKDYMPETVIIDDVAGLDLKDPIFKLVIRSATIHG